MCLVLGGCERKPRTVVPDPDKVKPLPALDKQKGLKMDAPSPPPKPKQ
jgi:hypothetical protein